MKEKIIPKNYGSIPHLSTSKLSQKADKKITYNQELILTKKARDWRDLIIVTEKLDGSNVGVIKKNAEIIPITRSGYPALSSKYRQHRLFYEWVMEHIWAFEWIPEGYRLCGEWMIQAHGTKYDITKCSPFVAFDIFTEKNERILYLNFSRMCFRHSISTVPLLHIGQPISIDNAIKLMGDGNYGDGIPEGFVYRLERNKKVEFLAKWVRADKEDGKYLDQEIFNKGFNNG